MKINYNTVNALTSVNVIVWPNNGLVAFAWCTLLADQRLMDVWNNTCQHSTDAIHFTLIKTTYTYTIYTVNRNK